MGNDNPTRDLTMSCLLHIAYGKCTFNGSLTILSDLRILNTLKFSAITATSGVEFFPEANAMISGAKDYEQIVDWFKNHDFTFKFTGFQKTCNNVPLYCL